MSRAGSTEMKTVRGGFLPDGSMLIALPRVNIVSGQTSGQWVKPKKTSDLWPLRLSSVVGEPVWEVRWNGPPMASDARPLQTSDAVCMPDEMTPGSAATPPEMAGLSPEGEHAAANAARAKRGR